MKLLKVKATGFKNSEDDVSIDLVAKSKKTSEDKEYELQEIAEDLYTFNTIAFVGKNASGKTTAIELLDCCYSLLGEFRLEDKHYSFDNVDLEMHFYHEDNIYKYTAEIKTDNLLGNRASFYQQHLFRKKYYKSKLKSIFDDKGFDEMSEFSVLPEDTSILFFVLKKKMTHALYFDSFGDGVNTYQLVFNAMKNYDIDFDTFLNVIRIFDENIKSFERMDEHNYKLIYRDESKMVSDKELLYFLSSGTTKGILLYMLMAASLKNGFDLLVDEIENHFHKTLVENMISLYKDKNVNRKNASLIFTTHYCELLDLFNRRDNIWISKADEKVHFENMYEQYEVRTELLKSRQFYNNVFQTAVNYDELMNLKKGADEMKLLIMCEGPNELEIIKILLRHNCLNFTIEDLVNLMPYHARQIDKSTVIQNALGLYQGEFKILRIGDALNEKLRIPAIYRDRALSVEKYCTKPELEMLLIIAENLDKEFEKVKSSVKPKNFAKNKIKCGRKKYDNSTRFYTDYFGDNVELLVNCIKSYKQKRGNHKKDELYLADLLK